jgi:DNA-binding MarR family transcriptional regulator
LLRQAASAYRRRMEAALADLEVTQPQYAVLALLNAYPGLSNADLARVAVLTPQTLSVIVANLEKAGALTKRPHPVHGRILCLELTERGRSLRATALKRVRALESEVAAGYSEEERKVVRRWLSQLAAG